MRLLPGLLLLASANLAFADGVFDVCKGESKTAVAGTGKLSIAVVYPDDFPVTTTPQSRNAVGASIARAEKAKIVPAKDVEAAKNLVGAKKWQENSEACGYAPSLVAVLGMKHPNLSTARAKVECEGDKCQLIIDLERHGKHTAERFIRYAAPLNGPKDKLATITAAAGKLAPKGVPPDASKVGLAVSELPEGVVVARSDADGALELDRTIEGTAAVAQCAPKKRKAHDHRGYWIDWKLTARGNPYQVQVHPFGGADPADQEAAQCLKKALEATQMACPRDGKTLDVKTALCL
jgi:hypothetical protein